MMDFLDSVRNVALHDAYLMFCMAVMALPIIGIAIWYHGNINASDGGRQLMSRQNKWRRRRQRRGGVAEAQDDFRTAGQMAKDIQAGHYGDHARTMQNKVYIFILLWLLAVASAFGILIWAVETTPGTG
jgi:hypothetical protein